MVSKPMITVRELREILDYSQETGVFTNKISRSSVAQRGTVAGSLNQEGYRQIGIGGRVYLGHRLAWLWMTGDWPKHGIDHANGLVDDNSWANLRDATHSENCANRKSINKHGYKGVVLAGQRWYAQNRKDGKLYVSRG